VIVLGAVVAAATLVAGVVLAQGVRRLRTVRSQVVATALVSLCLPLVAVSVSGLIMFHMGADLGILAVSAAAAVAALSCALVVSSSIARRLATVRKGAAAMAAGSLTVRVPVDGPAELAELATSFNAMAESVERLFATRREVVAWASHDLRSPIASLRAMIEATEDGVVAPGHYLPAMADRVLALGGLVDDLFELASLDAGALTLEFEVVPPDRLVNRCLGGFAAEAERRRIRLEPRLDEGLPGVRCAPEAIERVLDNLVANAFRFTPEGGSVVVAAEAVGDGVAVTVEDSGTGFDPATVDRATEPFWQHDGARSHDDAGRSHAGLGLSIAKGLVELQGGSLLVGNRPGGGGRVSFTLLRP